jgi:hypothetical protein
MGGTSADRAACGGRTSIQLYDGGTPRFPRSLPLLQFTSTGTAVSERYCNVGHGKINAWLTRGAAARDSVNFRKFSPCIARARRARAGLTVYPPSRTLEVLAFDEYCRFDTSSFASAIKRASLYRTCERSGIKTAIFIES